MTLQEELYTLLKNHDWSSDSNEITFTDRRGEWVIGLYLQSEEDIEMGWVRGHTYICAPTALKIPDESGITNGCYDYEFEDLDNLAEWLACRKPSVVKTTETEWMCVVE